MYSYIIGVITQKEQGKVTLENNGIGYEINVSNQTLEMLEFDNEPVKIYTYLVVREDEMSLYGFITKEEKNKIMISIKEEYQSNGYGKTLFKNMLNELTKIGYKEIKLTIPIENYRIKNIILQCNGLQLSTLNNEEMYVIPLENNEELESPK